MAEDEKRVPADDGIYGEVCGSFLVARLQTGGIFNRSVVWISAFVRGVGAHGVIVNLPLGKTLGRCAPQFAGTPMADIPMFVGGPVNDDRLAFLLRFPADMNGNASLQYGVSEEILRDSVLKPGVRAYAFAGCAEWAPGQLEGELTKGFWYVARADAEIWNAGGATVFWRRLMRKIDAPDAFALSFAPEDLALN